MDSAALLRCRCSRRHWRSSLGRCWRRCYSSRPKAASRRRWRMSRLGPGPRGNGPRHGLAVPGDAEGSVELAVGHLGPACGRRCAGRLAACGNAKAGRGDVGCPRAGHPTTEFATEVDGAAGIDDAPTSLRFRSIPAEPRDRGPSHRQRGAGRAVPRVGHGSPDDIHHRCLRRSFGPLVGAGFRSAGRPGDLSRVAHLRVEDGHRLLTVVRAVVAVVLITNGIVGLVI